jgi:hypothetical protein
MIRLLTALAIHISSVYRWTTVQLGSVGCHFEFCQFIRPLEVTYIHTYFNNILVKFWLFYLILLSSFVEIFVLTYMQS